jgi:hypothetical protein
MSHQTARNDSGLVSRATRLMGGPKRAGPPVSLVGLPRAFARGGTVSAIPEASVARENARSEALDENVFAGPHQT